VDPARVIGWGRSVGGGAVCALARERALAALVLESTFTSVRSIAQGLGLPGFLVRDPLDSLAVLAAFPGPVLIVHGARQIPMPTPAFATRRRRAADREPGCRHNDARVRRRWRVPGGAAHPLARIRYPARGAGNEACDFAGAEPAPRAHLPGRGASRCRSADDIFRA
jgi:hypothetical protein